MLVTVSTGNDTSPNPPHIRAAISTAGTSLVPICILGLGLIGGSMMRDLQTGDHVVFGWNRSQKTVQEACAEGFDASADLTATLQRAEKEGALIVIGTPMTVVGKMLDQIREHAPSCGITDVVSVKGAVYDEVCARDMQDRYVGAHPMAGSAKAGWDATVTELFDAAPWVITYDYALACEESGTEISARWQSVFTQVAKLGKALRSHVVPATAPKHDDAVARISHMPHLAAYAIAAVGDAGGQLPLSLAAGSFRDTTRVAAAAPEMVMSWCDNNVEPVLGAVDELISRLSAAREQLAREGTASDLARAGYDSRHRYEACSPQRSVMRVRVGAPGWINQLKLAESIGGQIELF